MVVKMRFEDIEIHTGDLDRPYRPIKQIKVTVRGGSLLVQSTGANEVNAKLRERAIALGANAVIKISYHRGATLSSWQSAWATGLAVDAESDTTACPVCAETVKRAAKKCKHCGAELPGLADADWYPDPKGEARLRYWNGTSWTEHTAA